MSDRIRACYISAGSNLDVLRDELAAKGIRVAIPSDLLIGRVGARADVLLGSVKTAIESSEDLALEQVAALAFRRSGVEVIAEQAMSHDRG